MSSGFEKLKGSLAVILASAVCLVAGYAQAGHPCSCGREHVGPCTLGPTPYGYYPAQWRRWPTDEAVASAAPHWRPANPSVPRLAPQAPQHSSPMGAGKRSPEQLFEEELPSLPPRGQAPPPAAPKAAPGSEDPFKDDSTSTTPFLPHAPAATPAVAPRAPWTSETNDKEVQLNPLGSRRSGDYAGRPRSVRNINPLDDDAGLEEPALVENKRQVVPASRTAAPVAQSANDEAEPVEEANPLRSHPAKPLAAASRRPQVSLDESLNPEQEESRLESANEPQLLPAATRAAPLAKYNPGEDANDSGTESKPVPPEADEPQLIEPTVENQAAEPLAATRSEATRWRESDVIRSGFSRSKAIRRPIATSESNSSNPLRGSSSSAANPLR